VYVISSDNFRQRILRAMPDNSDWEEECPMKSTNQEKIFRADTEGKKKLSKSDRRKMTVTCIAITAIALILLGAGAAWSLRSASGEEMLSFEEMQSSMKSQLQEEMQTAAAYLEKLDGSIAENQKKLEEVNLQLTERQKSLLEVETTQKKLEENASDISGEVSELEKKTENQINTLQKDMNSIHKDIQSTLEKVTEMVRVMELEEQKNVTDHAQTMTEMNRMNESIRQVNQMIGQVETDLDESYHTLRDFLYEVKSSEEKGRTEILSQLSGVEKNLKLLLEADMVQITEAFSKLTTEFEEQVAELARLLDSRFESLDQNMDGLNTSMGQLGENMSGLDSNMGQLGENMNGLNTSMGQLGENMNGLDSNMGQLGENMNGLNTSMSQLGENMSGLDSNMGQLGENMNGLNTSMGQLGENMSGLDSNMGQLGENMSGLNSNVGQLGENISSLKDGLGNNMSDLSSSLGSLDSKVSSGVGSLQSQVNALNSAVLDNFKQIQQTLTKQYSELSQNSGQNSDDLKSYLQELNGALRQDLNQVFTLVSNGKKGLASALLTKGVSVEEDAAFAEIRDAILGIEQEIVLGVQELPGNVTYHYHYHENASGENTHKESSSVQGGCYTIPVAHVHSEEAGCYTEERYHVHDEDCPGYPVWVDWDGEGYWGFIYECNNLPLNESRIVMNCSKEEGTVDEYLPSCGLVDGQIIGAEITYDHSAAASNVRAVEESARRMSVQRAGVIVSEDIAESDAGKIPHAPAAIAEEMERLRQAESEAEVMEGTAAEGMEEEKTNPSETEPETAAVEDREEPAEGETITEETVTEEKPTEETVTEENSAKEAITEENSAEETVMEETATEAAAAEEAVMEEMSLGEAAVEDAPVGEITAEEVDTEE